MLMMVRVREFFREAFASDPYACQSCGSARMRVVAAIPDDRHPRAEVLRCESCGECREIE